MGGLRYKYDDAEARGLFLRLTRAADNPAPALDAIGNYSVLSTRGRFKTETDPSGKAWKPLRPRTANSRRAGSRLRRGHNHILRATTELYQSITYDAQPRSVEWGSNVAYAAIHNEGGTIKVGARTQRLSLKKTRRIGGGFKSRFARAGTKGATARTVKIGAHTIRMPARRFLGVNEEDRKEHGNIVADFLLREADRGQ